MIRPHLGLLYVAAVLRQTLGIEVRIIDSNVDDITLDDLKGIIATETPDIVGFSVLTFNLLNCLAVSRMIRENSPHSIICYGGWHPTLYPEETLKQNCVDYVIIGEGERTFTELVKAGNRKQKNFGQKLSEIKGLGYKTVDGKIRINIPREPVKNLDEIPFPAYDLIDTSKYSNLLANTDHVATIMTSRGCPHRCIFCDLRRKPYRYRSPGNIIEEIKFLAKSGAREFFIQDDNFTLSHERTIEFCKLLINANLNIKYKISSRIDYLTNDLMKYLKQSGCYSIYLGVESGSQRMLDYLEKEITLDQIKNAFQLTRKYGIDGCAYIMIGIPPETRSDIDKTMRLIKEIRPDHLHCSICTPMPKTFLYKKLMKERLIKNDYWLEFAKNPDPNFKTPFKNLYFSDSELRNMQNSIQKKFYFQPRIIFYEILKTKGWKQFFSKAKMAFKIFCN